MKTPSTLVAAVLLSAAMIGISCSANGAQKADSTFDARVEHPAYPKSGPRVVIDESHRNFHTASGRYRPFAQLIGNDGYRVERVVRSSPSDGLRNGDILVISNAQGPKNNLEWESAFTTDEVAAVRDWVSGGGSLLLIADHFPMGGAAEKLSLAFGVEMSKGWPRTPCTASPARRHRSSTARERAARRPPHHRRPQRRGVPDARRGLHRTVDDVPAKTVAFLKLGATAQDYRPQAPKIDRSGGNVRISPQYGDPEPAAGRAGDRDGVREGAGGHPGRGRHDDRPDHRRRPSVRHERAGQRQPPARTQHHALAVAFGVIGTLGPILPRISLVTIRFTHPVPILTQEWSSPP